MTTHALKATHPHGEGSVRRQGGLGTALFGMLFMAVNLSGYPTISNMLIGGTLALALLGTAGRGRFPTGAKLALPLVLAWLMSGLWVNSLPITSTVELSRWLAVDGRLLVAVIPLFVIYRSRLGGGNPAAALRICVAGAAINALLALLSFAGVGRDVLLVSGHFSGLMSSHHASGYVYAGVVLVLAFGEPRVPLWQRNFGLMASGVILLTSGSRTSLLGIAFAMAYFAVTSGRLQGFLRSTGALVTGGILLTALSFRVSSTVRSLLSPDFQSLLLQAFLRGTRQRQLIEYVSVDGILPGLLANIVSRFYLWGNGIGIWLQSPYLGIGAGRVNDSALRIEGWPGWVAFATDGVDPLNGSTGVHNQYLQTLAELGLVGLGLLLILWIGLLRWCLRNGHRDGVALVVFALGTAVTGNTLESPGLTYMVLGWVALLMTTRTTTGTREGGTGHV